MFRHPWALFRKTLLIEHPSWIVDPRVYSTRQADSFFTQEALLSNRVNLAFYNQFPSLVTGIGLLFTFLALFIGLSKLHADGQNIDGIQGLINGLAGKFLTSIVGLVCANAFALIEKPVVFRLTAVHQEFLGFMNELFPQKTVEQLLEDLTSLQKAQAVARSEQNISLADHARSSTASSLTEPIAALTSTVQSFIRVKEQDQIESRQRIMTDVRRTVQAGIDGSFKDLKETMKELSTVLKGLRTSQERGDAHVDRLVARLSDVLNKPSNLPPGQTAKSVYGSGIPSGGQGQTNKDQHVEHGLYSSAHEHSTAAFS
jgi:hypothetical protein